MSKKKEEEDKGGKLSEPLQQCAQILKQLQNKAEAGPFLEPVDWESLQLNDYPEIIKKPMDLGTIQKKLESGKYASPDKFAGDVRLVWKNAMTYNRSDSDIYTTAETLSKLFEKKFAKIKKTTPKRKTGEKDAPPVTRAEKVKFTQLVNQLSSDQLSQVVAIIHHSCADAINEDSEDVLEIEINSLDGGTLAQLNAFAASAIAENAKKKKKPDPAPAAPTASSSAQPSAATTAAAPGTAAAAPAAAPPPVK